MNKKDYLKKREALLNEAENLINEGKLEEFNAKEEDIKALDEKFETFGKMQSNLNALKGDVKGEGLEMEGKLEGKVEVVDDLHNTVDYRKAFMNYCQTGVMDSKFQNADAQTTVTEAGAVVPTTIMEEVIKKMKSYGQIFSRVRKTNIKGGVDVPILSLKPVAAWIDESAVSDRKKITINTKVSFSYYGLECRVAVSLLADVTSLAIFETTITQIIVEAMIKAMETAVIKGTGSGQPLGITVDERIPADNVITLSASDFAKWDGWKKKVFAKIPLAYRAGGAFVMAPGTYEGYIDGMVDANGQPIGRTNYGIANAPQERFGGREVILVEDDIIAPYESANAGDVVAVFCKLSDYCINSNMQMQMFRWFDQDTNQYVDKAILIADGKILDPNGVIIVKKG